MKQLFLASGCLALLSLGLAARASQAPAPAAAQSAPAPRAAAPRTATPRAASTAPRAGSAGQHDGGRRTDAPRHHLLRDLPQRTRQGRRPLARQLGRDEGAAAARGRREDDPQAARRHDAAARREEAGRRRHRLAHRRARDPHGRIRGQQPESRAGGRSSASRAPNTRPPCATCSTSRSTSPRTCPPTRRPTASTTSPKRRPSRRRCSMATCAPPPR